MNLVLFVIVLPKAGEFYYKAVKGVRQEHSLKQALGNRLGI